MATPGHQELELMRNTLSNLRYIECDQGAQRCKQVFEVTQLINSFLGILAHPWEKLFDPGQLAIIELDTSQYRSLGFPTIQSSWPEGDTDSPSNLAELLRLLRNGIAHGNIDLWSKFDLKLRFDKEPVSDIGQDEIAGAEIWNSDHVRETKNWPGPIGRQHYREPFRTWGTVLTIDEMRSCLDALIELSNRSEYVRTSALKRNGGKRTREKAHAAIKRRIDEDRVKL
jgi:hypothetical protein